MSDAAATTPKATAPKETKAQRLERLKREKNPWEGLEEIRQFAREGRASIPPEWAGAYFKWWGVYTQGDGIGAIGGKGGEGKATEYFMMRIGIPNGLLHSNQLRKIASLTERYARGKADITVRQNIQLHWLTIASLPEIIDELATVSLGCKGACGDVVRNVTGCPLAGIAHDELIDASPLALEASHLLSANPEFYNLPRKFKISITGCPAWCSYPEINDVGFTAVERTVNGIREVGFALRVGGGLSSEPHLAVRIDAFIKQDQVIPVTRTVAEIFRDQQVLRESRDRARLKYLFSKFGWTAEGFRDELEKRLGYKLEPGVPDNPPDDIFRDHVGIHRQHQDGLCYVGASVVTGRLTSQQLSAIADLSDKFGNGEVRTTVMQNILIANVPAEKAIALAEQLERIGLHVEGTTFWRGAIACTGTEFCKLAITETKGFTRWVVEELEQRVPQFDQQLKLHVTGCPNSCGQHWIADIGIEGKKLKVNGKMVDAYNFCVGGAVGEHQQISRPLSYRCLATEVPEAIERLLRGYLGTRTDNENLRAFLARHSNDELRMILAGAVVEPVARDASPGPVPQAVLG